MSNPSSQRVVRPSVTLGACLGLFVGMGATACGTSSDPVPEPEPSESSGGNSDQTTPSGDSDANPSDGTTCAAGQTQCSGQCVSLAIDAAHCGSCTTSCAAGQVCAQGSCQCEGGRTTCNGKCVDLKSDGNNCGVCATACPVGQVCSGGACATSCSGAGEQPCGNSCVNVQTDSTNCGACGAMCPTGRTCQAGRCDCAAGLVACTSGCVDVQTDPNNCGTCGNRCAGGSCSAGVCVGSTPGAGGTSPGAGGATSGGASPAASGTSPGAGGATSGGASPAAGGSVPASGGSAAGGTAAGGASTGGAATGGTPAEPAPTSGCGIPEPATAPSTLTSGGTPRTFIVDVPAGYTENTPYPITFGFHGMSASAEMYSGAFYGNLGSTLADEYILVYPDGLGDPTTWDTQGDTDIQFFDDLLALIKSTYCVDANRVFVTGHSMGGLMSNTLGCKRGDVVRAIAPISGGGPSMGGFDPGCVGQVAAWIAHGTNDDTVALSSGEGSRDYWVEANTCDINTTTAPSAAYPCVAYADCDAGFPVWWCQYDGDHMPPDFGPQAIYDFFSQFK